MPLAFVRATLPPRLSLSIARAWPPTNRRAACARAPIGLSSDKGRQQDRQCAADRPCAASARASASELVALRPLAHQPGRADALGGLRATRHRRHPAPRAGGRPARGRRARRRAAPRSPPRGRRSAATRLSASDPCRRTISLSDSTIGCARGFPAPAASATASRHHSRRMRASIGSLVTLRVRASSWSKASSASRPAALRLGREQGAEEAVAVGRRAPDRARSDARHQARCRNSGIGE